ncbi:dermonecrotic toxin domain-containing protein [Pseudomonas synxantha]|uniref:Uncharacterized protein n=1 Tax=Pseudomonas synxantha TaxID=47883 RepID=A0ACC6JJF1_9PSED|nr:DUF6543 domain-containing protein [Pseudomonas synxantha]MDR6606648.1 hypothetical protein [Pseudomonas synxantha]
MLDEPAPIPTDFGLAQPLVANPDQNLFLGASARWNDCREQWLELMAQRPPPSSDTDWSVWWSARARGTALSREAQAIALYRQHFEASSQLAYADGTLTTEQTNAIQTIVHPNLEGSRSDVRQLRVEQPRLQSTDGTSIELSGALVIRLGTEPLAANVLYLPFRQSAWLIFTDQDELERWLIEQQPALPGQSSVAYTLFDHLALQKSAQSVLTRWSSDPIDNAAVFTPAPDLPIDDSSEPPSVFGLLSPDIPLGMRHSALAQQQRALDTLLDENVQGQYDDFKQQLDDLFAAQQASTTAALALLDADNPLNMLKLRRQPNPHYSALYQARLAGLHAEANVQLSLKQISAQEHQWLKTVLETPDQIDRHTDVVVARLILSATDTDGATTLTEELDGVLVFTHPSTLLTSAPNSLLLYWPGRFGGLQRFASRQALEHTLFKLPANDNTQALHLSAMTRNPFDYMFQIQLYSCEQQTARLITANPVPSHANQRTVALEKLREQTIARLTVPIPAALELAYAQIIEQQNSSTLAGALPSWLVSLSDAQRTRLRGLFTSYIKAMKRSHALLERELPLRDDFSEKAIDTRLRRDFNLKQRFTVKLDVPDSTTWRKVVTDGAAPGTPLQNVLIASPQRSLLKLAELAQLNIDQAMWWRLAMMKVQIDANDETERETLKSAIKLPYLRQLVTEMDLAGQYETLIRETFLGTSAAPAFSNEYRRECLVEPWRLMLMLQGEFALLKRDINADAWHLLQIAIDANSREAYSVNGKQIVLLPAHLSVGGADTDNEGPSTLAGVTFIHERNSGLTLLYLPDSPDQVLLRQYGSLEQARKALFNLCLHSNMVNYLAQCTLKGDVARHVSRINQALLKNFDAMIGIGTAWPPTTSLASHLLNVHMGRLVQAHRATSRSNDALYLERYALKSVSLFNYLKMAIGMLPFVGAALALYDAWNSANRAVAAALRGDLGDGLAGVEAVLLALIDAAMDILPGTVAAPAAARLATRQRQAGSLGKHLGALQIPSVRQARRTRDVFKGYEYEKEISLAGLQPGTDGLYRQVYRHADGHFMISQGRVYRIELSDNARGWRLSGSSTRTYKQPIALDEAGDWNTHYAIYGTAIEGGGAGGGAVLGHMADGLDPLWPAAVRQWLPRWWTDRTLRRQQALTNTADAYTRQLDTHTRNTNSALDQYYRLEPSQRPARRTQLNGACANDIDIAQNQYRNLEELKLLTHGRKRTQAEAIQSTCAWVVVDRSLRQVNLATESLLEHLNRIDELIARSETPGLDAVTQLQLLAQRKAIRKTFLEVFDQQHAAVEQANSWNARITHRTQKNKVKPDLDHINEKLGDTTYVYLKTAHLLETIGHYDAIDDLSWVYFHVHLKETRDNVGRTLLNQHQLPEVRTSAARRNKILEDCLATYAQLRRNLNAWTLGYPQHLELSQVAVFLDNLKKVEDLARGAIKNRPTSALNEGRTGKKIFETEDNRLLIGVENTDIATRQKRFTVERADGRTETWLPRSNGKYHLSGQTLASQPELPTHLGALLAEARTRLGAASDYQSKVQGYARQHMLPIDLEHMMSSEAAEFNMRAQAIERLSPTEPLAQQLRARADEFLRSGRTLRIDQTLSSKTPTEGYLDYLLEQQVVDIRKEGGLRDLGKRPDRTRDFLQEYEVRDLRSEPAQTLWYAHFHYTSAKPQFSDFVKGHLKLPEQRNLGLKWQQAVAATGAPVDAIWRGDIGKPLGNKHFSTL